MKKLVIKSISQTNKDKQSSVAKLKFKSKMLRYALVIFGAYTALLIVNLPSFFYFLAQSSQPVDWRNQLVKFVWGMYIWVPFAYFILWVGARFRIAHPKLLRNILIHLLVSILTGVTRLIIYYYGLWILGVAGLAAIQTELLKPLTYIQAITGAIVTYPTIVAVQQAYLYFRESQERTNQLQQAELQMLKMQIQPHFFFNTLNAISALIHKSPEEADKMIVRLGGIFRTALKENRDQKVTLKEELDLLKTFLEIHQTLMKNRLQVIWKIDSDTLDSLVPNLILQPLAENAIQHGIAPRESGGQIIITAQRSHGKLVLQVIDNGLGFSVKNNRLSEGIGLSNTRARLENLYPNADALSIEPLSSGGTCVKIKIPFL